MNKEITTTDNTETALPIKDEAERLIELAITKKADVETMEKLLAMRREFKAEKAKEAFDIAMAKFQKECPTIEKRKQGYNYKYADLTDIVEQIKQLLADNGFSYTFDTDEAENAIVVYCKVKHIDGHMEISKATISKETTSKMNASQQSGAAMTYGKRYALVNAFGILTGDEDTDAATPTTSPNAPQQTKTNKSSDWTTEDEELANSSLDDSTPYNRNTLKEKAWCRKHPKSYIGRDQHGNWYKKCVFGNKANEECEIVIETA